MAAGILTALVIVLSQVFFFQAAEYSTKEVKTEKQDPASADDHAYFLSVPVTSILSTSHISLNVDFTFIVDVLFQPAQESDTQTQTPLALGKFFQTLFKVIIAPNAP